MSEEKQPYRKCKKIRSLSFCIEDIPESAYVKSEKNGKTYFNLIIEELEPDQWGNDMIVSLQQSVEERKNKTPKTKIGYTKTLWTNPDLGGSVFTAHAGTNSIGSGVSNQVSNGVSNQAPDKDLPF